MGGPDTRKAGDITAKADANIQNRSLFQRSPGKFRVSGDKAFYTLQGEGTSMGKPAVFLRLHHCNLECTWCDAWYTWHEGSDEFWTESVLWTIDETRNQVQNSWACESRGISRRLVVTGGEPLIQQEQIEQLISELPDWEIEIETNGTIMPRQSLLDRCQFNCSPKLANSGNAAQRRIKEEVLRKLNGARSIFKFVVQKPEDIEEIERDFVIPCALDAEKVIVMPEGVTIDEIAGNARAVVEMVKAKGYRMLGRLHCTIWGAERGV